MAPNLRLVQTAEPAPETILAGVRDYLDEQASRLPLSDEWRDALAGIASDLSLALELREREHGPPAPYL